MNPHNFFTFSMINCCNSIKIFMNMLRLLCFGDTVSIKMTAEKRTWLDCYVIGFDFHSHNLLQLNWPTKSPDFNPIEYWWDILEQLVKRRKQYLRTLVHFCNPIRSDWLKLDATYQKNLLIVPSHLNPGGYQGKRRSHMVLTWIVK